MTLSHLRVRQRQYAHSRHTCLVARRETKASGLFCLLVGWKTGFRTTQSFPDYPDWWTKVHRSPIQIGVWGVPDCLVVCKPFSSLMTLVPDCPDWLPDKYALGYMPSWSQCSGVGLLTCNTHE